MQSPVFFSIRVEESCYGWERSELFGEDPCVSKADIAKMTNWIAARTRATPGEVRQCIRSGGFEEWFARVPPDQGCNVIAVNKSSVIERRMGRLPFAK